MVPPQGSESVATSTRLENEMTTEDIPRLSGEWMTPRRRFISALFGGRVDKVPAMTLSSVATLEGMEIADADFPEAHLDAEKMAS